MTTKNRRLISIMLLVCSICYLQARRLRWVGELGFAMDVISANYYSEVDRRELYESAMRGMTKSLDRYSGYIEAKEYDQFQQVMEQKFGGIGIMIDGPPRIDRLTVIIPLFDTPAYRAGLQPGDVILEVDGKSLAGLTTEEATDLMQGPEGSTVELLVERAKQSSPLTVRLERASIELESVVGDRRRSDARWNFRLQDSPDLGYIRITSFGEKTVKEMKEALQTVTQNNSPPLRGLILDLRDNPGGLMTSATDICDMFMEEGTIVSTKGREERFQASIEAERGTLLDDAIPIVVLINDQSASAAEIVAACLQDVGRAKIAGQRSFGKGSVQNVVELEGGKSALKLTTARYYPPSGKNIHRQDKDGPDEVWGVIPSANLQVDVDEEHRLAIFQRWRLRGANAPEADQDEIDKNDPQLAKAIEFLRSKANPAPQAN